MKTIICGSKKYKNINLNKLVDSFAVIVRNNFLLPNMGYGLQQSNYSQYGYDNRKVWAVEQKDLALTVINKLRDTEVQKNL